MGIDCYIRWEGQTWDEMTDPEAVWHLRENMGGVHAVTWLLPEAFADENGSLDQARELYGNGGERRFAEAIFGALANPAGTQFEQAFKEIEEEMLKPPRKWPWQRQRKDSSDSGEWRIIHGPNLDVAASGFPPEGYCIEAEEVGHEATFPWGEEMMTETVPAWYIPSQILRQRLPLVEELTRKRYEGEPWVEEAVEHLNAFVSFYEKLEREGPKPSLEASY